MECVASSVGLCLATSGSCSEEKIRLSYLQNMPGMIAQ